MMTVFSIRKNPPFPFKSPQQLLPYSFSSIINSVLQLLPFFLLTSPQIEILRVSGLCKNPIFMMSSCFPCRSATRSKKWSECMYTKVEEKNIYGINPISRLGTKKKDKHAIDGPQVWAKSCWWYFGLKFNCSRSSSVNFSLNYSTLLLAESNNFVTIWCNDNKRVIHLL